MTESTPTEDGTLVWLAEFHQDLVNDALTNPAPELAAQLVANAYDAAERAGHTIIQWRIACMPRPLTNEEYFRTDPDKLPYLEGRRVMKMTAHTAPRGEKESMLADVVESAPPPITCGKYSRPGLGGILGPCKLKPGHETFPGATWHLDAGGAAWDPATDR